MVGEDKKRARAVIPAWVSRHGNPVGNGRARSDARAKGRRRARNGLAERARGRCSGYARVERVDVLVVRRRGSSPIVSFFDVIPPSGKIFGYRPSTAKRDGVSLETIQALKLVRDVDGSVSKTRARCGARARPFGVLCDATPRTHIIRQPPCGQKMGNTGADSTRAHRTTDSRISGLVGTFVKSPFVNPGSDPNGSFRAASSTGN